MRPQSLNYRRDIISCRPVKCKQWLNGQTKNSYSLKEVTLPAGLCRGWFGSVPLCHWGNIHMTGISCRVDYYTSGPMKGSPSSGMGWVNPCTKFIETLRSFMQRNLTAVSYVRMWHPLRSADLPEHFGREPRNCSD